ncbi:hypothetical protein NP493_336g03008 [Ridgeia piscesae]|uniref:Uncharacterized protein n=1 Tax=Ridgeia piscesae TaxID=27915 RepID=A0AAD9NUF5_RIDPI|nr:hypothetical protein NP493_336g03008 [Ridgeia piscesae]
MSFHLGFSKRAGYIHGKAYSDLMGVTYDGRMKQFILLDSKGVTTWSKDAVRKKGVRALNFGQFQHRSITSIVYGRNMNIYFALGKDFDLMVLNRDFQQTCKVSSQLRSVVFMVFNPVTNELITGGVGGTKIWKYEQLAELSWSCLTPMSNYQLVLKRELPSVGGSWVKRVDLDERLQQLYCCSSMDIHAYRMDGSEVFSFLRAHTLGITGCVYSHTAQLLVSSAEDTTVKVWNVKGGWIHTFHGHSRGITNLLLHPECHATAVTSSLDGSVRMWSLHTLEPLYSVVVSSDGIKWMGLMDDNLLYLSTLRELTVWSLNHVTDFWALTRCHIKQLSLAHSVGKSTCVTALGDDSSVRVLCRASGKKLSTVLPPPDLSPMAQILCVTYNRAAKVIYLLLNTKVVWVYTTRTDPACRLYVWDIISIQEELSHDYNYQLAAGCSNPFVDAHTHARTLVTLVECRTICYLESPVVVQTPAGQCCPLRDNFLLMGLEVGQYFVNRGRITQFMYLWTEVYYGYVVLYK